MSKRATERKSRLESREGFVMPAVIFVLAILSIIAVAAIWTANDEHRSSRALRESGSALYAGEAGIHYILGTVDDSVYKNLAQGASRDLGWDTLPNGATYHATLFRSDAGNQELYRLNVEGQGAGPWGGERVINLALTLGGMIPIRGAFWGLGEAEVESGVTVSGFDRVPAGWGGVCSDPLEDKPGITVADTTQVDVQGGSTLEGTPPLVQDTTITNTNLFDWGSLTYADLVAMATIQISGTAGKIEPKVAGGVCKTSDNRNWGDPLDPTSPCFNYFPIIHVNPEVEISQGGYGQGILLVDAGIEVASNFSFYGLVISPGEVELTKNVTIIGSMISGKEAEAERGPNILYSQCAAERAMEANGIGSIVPLSMRSWSEVH